ncbi:hypothetical protein EmuJ_000166100 [Echinococcus multilocularis]|uniref:Uncharacterized protein n=1 Tax=Echinococcus multilocularis TaxID=6211 RepID=A0A087W008_ECHMU|nr:hypothetical protein EmuJ_000166100 [Echinococcus multilocularis]
MILPSAGSVNVISCLSQFLNCYKDHSVVNRKEEKAGGAVSPPSHRSIIPSCRLLHFLRHCLFQSSIC